MNEFVVITGKFTPKKYIDKYEYIKKYNLVLKVTKTLKTRLYVKVLDEYKEWLFDNHIFSISLKNLNKVNENFVKNNIKEYNIKKSLERNEKLNPKYTLIKDRIFENFSEKNYLNTNINFVNFLDSKNEILKNKWRYRATCCSFTKTLYKIRTYIPKLWLNYFGYKKEDLINYLKFLEKCDINFKLEKIEEIDIKKFKSDFNISGDISEHLNSSANNVFIGKEGFYTIEFETNKNSIWINYLYFILVRYIYCSLYWNIPGNAMKFKYHMPELTEWECLLLANSKENYNGYYSLNTLTESSVLNLCNSANIFNSLKKNTEYGLNSFFKVLQNKKLKEAIKKEDFEFIKNYTIKNRKTYELNK